MTPAKAAIAAMVAAAIATFTGAAPAAAQVYPTRPITIVVPFAAGGPTDVLSRVLGERIRAALGQPVLIENVTGAGGSIGVGRVVSAAPDGYTVSIGHFGTHVANGAIYPLKYDLLNDLDPVVRLPSNPMIVVTRKNFPDANLKELVDRLKAAPGRILRALPAPARAPTSRACCCRASPASKCRSCPIAAPARPCRTWSRARST